MRRLFIAVLQMSACLSARAVALPTEDQANLKVAIVFNILRFTRFDADRGTDLTLCVLGPPSLIRAFEKVDGERLPAGRISVRHGVRPSDLNGSCTIVYFASDAGYPPSAAQPLTIGEAPGFADHGAIALHQFGRQLSFEINTGIAARQGAGFSARLLNLAAGVRSR